MAWSFEKELGRKAIHLSSVFFLVIYFVFYYVFNHKVALVALCALLVILLELEYVRIELKEKIPLVSFFWKFRRRSEQNKLGSDVFFLIGSIIALAVFDVRIAFAAILMTTFGDAVSSIVSRFGRIPFFKGKKFEGVLAQLSVDLLIGFVFVRSAWVGLFPSGEVLWLPVIVMSVVATAVEVSITKIDDNLLIPVFAGLAGHLMLLL